MRWPFPSVASPDALRPAEHRTRRDRPCPLTVPPPHFPPHHEFALTIHFICYTTRNCGRISFAHNFLWLNNVQQKS